MRILNIINIIFFKKILNINSHNLTIMGFCRSIFKILLLFIKLSFNFFKKNIFLNILFYSSLLIKNKNIKNINILHYFFILDGSITSLSTISENYIESFDFLFLNLKWQERECREFLGINFFNKSDNRSLYLWSNFIGYPLKKDFPTIGFFELVNKYKVGLFFKKLIYV